MQIINLNNQSWIWNKLDHDIAAELLARQLPGVDHSSLKPFGQGDFCLAFKLGNQVLRIARHLEAAEALQRESCVLGKIAPSLPLPVPKPTYHAPHGCPPFTVHREITGKVLTRDAWENLPALAREKAASDLATFLKTLHSLPVEIGWACDLVQLDAARLARGLQVAVKNTIHELLEIEIQHRLDEALDRWSHPSTHDGQRSVLLHGDIAPGHLLYDPETGALTGVIDFGEITIGDPARDFIYVYEDYGPMLLREVLRHYTGEHRSKMISEIRKWYLLDVISWTVETCIEQCYAEMDEGLSEIRQELAVVASQDL